MKISLLPKIIKKYWKFAKNITINQTMSTNKNYFVIKNYKQYWKNAKIISKKFTKNIEIMQKLFKAKNQLKNQNYFVTKYYKYVNETQNKRK